MILQQFKKKIYAIWMSFVHRLAIVNTTVLLTVIYIFFIGIGAIVVYLLRKDLLKHRFVKANSYWESKSPVNHSIEQARHLF